MNTSLTCSDSFGGRGIHREESRLRAFREEWPGREWGWGVVSGGGLQPRQQESKPMRKQRNERRKSHLLGTACPFPPTLVGRTANKVRKSRETNSDATQRAS